MSEWKEGKLGEKCRYAFEKILISQIATYQYISTENMIENKGGVSSSDRFPSVDKVTRFEKGDILISNIRPYFKKIWFAKNDGGCSTDVLVFRANEDCDRKFLYYLLSQDSFFEYMMLGSKGTKMPRGDKDAIMDLDILFPSIPEQKAIAEVLASLDDKIDLLNRQNKTLEALAETYFRQWFIEEADEKWEFGKLGDYVTITRGASPRPIIDYVKNGTYPWIKIGDATSCLTMFINSTNEKIIADGIEKSVIAHKGDMILSNSATCGLPYIMGIDGCIHDGWLIFRQYKVLTKWFVYFLIRSMFREIIAQADGTVQDNLNTKILKDLIVPIPQKEKIREFDIIAEEFINKIKNNETQIQTLQKLRDTLLPKLISGEVRVEMRGVQ